MSRINNNINTLAVDIQTKLSYQKDYIWDILTNTHKIPDIAKDISDIELYIDEIDDILNDRFYWHWNYTSNLLLSQ